jgi:hypothetical protein
MKKILLSILLSATLLAAKSQAVLNEVYGNPGGSNSEFIELYNSTFGTENLDCYTLMTYWESGANKGWNVLDFPSAASIPSKGWYVLAPQTPFSVQGTAGAVANLNWNDVSFRNSSTGGDLRVYQVNGTTYTDVTPADNVAITDFADGTLNGGQIYITLLFKNGQLVNGFIGGGANGSLPAAVSSLPNLLNVPLVGSCSASSFDVNFSTLGIMEFFNPSGGNDNGYARTSDGKCGAWVKTAPQVNHTPGVSNGSAAGISGSLTTTELLQCSILVGNSYISRVNFDVTAVTGDATEAADFPVTVQLYYDFTPDPNNPGSWLRAPNGVFDGVDSTSPALVKTVNTIAEAGQFFDIIQTAYTFVVYKTKRGCFDKVVPIVNGCSPLPVDFKSFTATRNRNNVLLKWETSSELNNSGFAVERNLNGAWEQIAFVNSQAANGNSDALLSYTYNDLNSTKGITQYRIKQVDFDNKSKYTEIRSVRGLDQIGKVTVYPNPTSNGTVNVVFDDASVTRTIFVTDMSGRTLKQINNVTNNNITIDNLQPGMYTLRIMVPETGEQIVQKIVVNKR